MNSSRTEMPQNQVTAGIPGLPSRGVLFLDFLKLGITSFGGPSMVAYIRRLAVQKRQWMDDGCFLEGVALCQIIPGATAMQTAAYVGFKTRGLFGSIASFIGFGLPAFILMMLFSAVYSRTHSLPVVLSALAGLQAIVVSIMANAAYTFSLTTLKNWKGIATALMAGAMFGWGINPILVILASMILGVLLGIDTGVLASCSDRTIRHPETALWILMAAALAGFCALFLLRRELFELAAMMAIVNLFSFGGGFAAIPMLLHEVVDVHRWLDIPTFLNGIILGQITPGPIVITATFVGYLHQGFWGGITATVGMFLPSFLLVPLTAPYFGRLLASRYFLYASSGTLCSFIGLLLMVTVRFGVGMHWNVASIFLAAGAFAALALKVDILWVVLAGTAVSVAIL